MPDSAHNGDDPDLRRRCRYVIFLEPDEAIFTIALKDQFPDLTFMAEHAKLFGGKRPCSSLALSDSGLVWARVVRGWAPDFYLHIVRSRWLWEDGPGRGAGRWAWDPPTPSTGSVFSSYMPGDEAARRFVQRVWRIIELIATNRVKKGHPRGNELMGGDRVLMIDVKGGDIWCGHQALAWSQAGGNRTMLDGGFRPCDDWEMPHHPRYRDLMCRAMETEAWHAKTLDHYPPRDQSST
jgi:hypothetical protein